MKSFDVLIDNNSKPWLLEVNHTPSFDTETPLDKYIKKKLISDSFNLLNIDSKMNNKMRQQLKIEKQLRVLTGKKKQIKPRN